MKIISFQPPTQNKTQKPCSRRMCTVWTMCTANQRRAKFVFKTHVYDVDDVNSQGMTSHSCVRCGRLESMHIRPHLFAAQNCAPATNLNHSTQGSDVTPQSGRGLHSPRHVFVHTTDFYIITRQPTAARLPHRRPCPCDTSAA